ncbi:MAG: LysR family transcriptional regulator [Pseudomonadota bacterium]
MNEVFVRIIRTMNLDDLRLFRHIVVHGSLAAAARESGLSTTTVSERLGKLEGRFGVTLLNRTTRSLQLTDAGRTLLAGLEPLLEDADALDAHIRHGVDTLSGPLRLSAPSDLGRRWVSKLVDRFQTTHPQVQIELHLSDGYVDLVGAGFDLALRYGELADSALRVRQLWHGDRVVCAAPRYLERCGTPTRPRDLADHQCLVMRFGELLDNRWWFGRAETRDSVLVHGHRVSNDGDLVRSWCLDGAGIALKSTLDVADDIASGRLVQLFSTHRSHATPLQLLFPPGRRQPHRVRAFADFVADNLPGDTPVH